LDIEPDPAPGTSLLDLPTDEEVRAGDAPWDGQLLVSGLANVARGPLRMARFAFGMAAKGITMADTFRRVEGSRAILRAPKTPFNEVVGPRRELAFASVSLSDVRALRKAHDVKVNDVVLSIVGGAFRTYLEKLGELPEMPLVTGVPVSTRAEGDATQDNQISTMFVSLGTDVADPVARLKAIHTSTQGAKEMQRALGARQIQSIGEVASPLILSSAIRAIYRGGLMSRSPLRINTLVSNVPGPPIDLYMCGAKITGIFPCSVILEGMGINVTVISYGDRLDFGLHVDPDLVPDPWLVANAVPEAMAELMAASGLGSPTPVVDPFAPTRRTPAEPAAPAVETASAVTGAPAVARPRATTRKMSAPKAGA
jgi:WS/DGAT/MGAT family acyltransferase